MRGLGIPTYAFDPRSILMPCSPCCNDMRESSEKSPDNFQSNVRTKSSFRMKDCLSRIERRRDATRVIYEILSVGEMGASKTNIIFKVNLNHKLAERYTIFLTKKRLLRIQSDSRHKRY